MTRSRAFFGRRSLLRTAVRKYRRSRPRYVRQVTEASALGVRVAQLRRP
ncbi:hypothetical protein ABZ618_31620 [Streptomyces roseolus]